MPGALTITGDDFGLCEAVNEGIERAHRDGILTHASLMVAGPAAGDAVRRARRLPNLRVGLHLVAVAGPAVLPATAIPDLVSDTGWFLDRQGALALRYAFLPGARRQLAAEIRAQFAAFAATGLRLAHADAHKHMHLHPTVARLMLEIGANFDLRRIRVPAEPPSVMRACGETPTFGSRALHAWAGTLRRRVAAAGLDTSGAVYGITWTGAMTEDRVLRLLAALPDGDAEIYFHPAARRDELLTTLMPGYQHRAELAALLSPQVRAALLQARRASAAAAGGAAAPADRPASLSPSPPG